MARRLRLVFAGTPAAAVPSLERLLASRHEVVAVITRPDAPVGRGRKLAPSPVRIAAEAHGLSVFTPLSIDAEFLEQLTQLAPDCCPVVAYGALLPKAALDIPLLGWLNLHFSLLPAWRGAAPVQHAIAAGDPVTGASVFQLEEALDTGPVFGTTTEEIRPRDTAGALLERLAASGAELLAGSIDAIADGVARAVPQPADGISTAPKIISEHARIDWRRPAYAVERATRAYTPRPGAWSIFRDQRITLEPVELVPTERRPEGELAPGELRVERSRVLVGTARDPVELGVVRQPGKKAMPAIDWARGARPELGESFA